MALKIEEFDVNYITAVGGKSVNVAIVKLLLIEHLSENIME